MGTKESKDLTSKFMSESILNHSDPDLEEKIIGQIMITYRKQQERKHVKKLLLIYTGAQIFCFALIWLVLHLLVKTENIPALLDPVIGLLRKVGQLVLQYDYLIITFVFAFVFEAFLNKRKKVQVV